MIFTYDFMILPYKKNTYEFMIHSKKTYDFMSYDLTYTITVAPQHLCRSPKKIVIGYSSVSHVLNTCTQLYSFMYLCPVRLADLKVLLADFLCEKNNIRWLKKYGL